MKVEQVTMQLCIASGTTDWRQKVTDAVKAAGGILAVEVEGGECLTLANQPFTTPSALAKLAAGGDEAKPKKRKYTRHINASPVDHTAVQKSGTTTVRATDDEGGKLEIRK